MGQKCSSPPLGFDDSGFLGYCRKFNRDDGTYVDGFVVAETLSGDIQLVCEPLDSGRLPPSLCRYNNTRHGLRSNTGRPSSLSAKIKTVLYSNESLEVGQFQYARVGPNDNAQYVVESKIGPGCKDGRLVLLSVFCTSWCLM